MAGEMARRAGLDTLVAGNIGLPVLDALGEIEAGGRPPQAIVLELSSFQLESTSSLAADAATMLNLSEDHLDRYPGIAAYGAAKARIFQGEGIQVLNRDDPASMGMRIDGRALHSFGTGHPGSDLEWGVAAAPAGDGPWLAQGAARLMPVRELPVPGMHNVANALAALALARAIELPYPALLDALRGFRGLPHRMQCIAEVDGVGYYDDSKGTNVGATVAALAGFPKPVVLIAGGDGKGQDFSPLAPVVAKAARAVVLIGDSGEQDPEIYAEVVRRHPQAVRMIYIRNVNPDPARIDAMDRLIEEVSATGIQLVLSPDSVFAASHAAAEGLVAVDRLATVRSDKREDDIARPAKAGL
jgi:UDP-N-acetylmuramoylalanine--D-glutamate ligase